MPIDPFTLGNSRASLILLDKVKSNPKALKSVSSYLHKHNGDIRLIFKYIPRLGLACRLGKLYIKSSGKDIETHGNKYLNENKSLILNLLTLTYRKHRKEG